MKHIKNIFDFASQIFMIYGYTVIFLVLICVLFGKDAKEVSTLFVLGSQGLTVEALTQYLFLVIIIVSLKCILFTDGIINGFSNVARIVLMFVGVILVTVIFIITFSWFPIDNPWIWGLFFLCFFVSVVASVTIVTIKERVENKKLDEALQRLKRGEIDE